MQKELDICILADLHLGTMGSNPIELLKYLKSIKPGLLIISGVFINPDQFEKKYFSRKTLMIVHQIMQLALNGTKVVLVTGSGNEGLKRFSGVNIGNIHLRTEMLLKLRGEEYLVCNEPPGKTSSNFNKKVKWPFFKKLFPQREYGLKNKQLKNTSNQLVKYADSKGVSALISYNLHVHGKSEITLLSRTLKLLNPGSWYHSLTSLEFTGGQWELYTYNELDYGLFNPKLTVKEKKEKAKEEVFIIRKPIES